MQNSPYIPLAAGVLSGLLTIITLLSLLAGPVAQPALTELQIGLVAWAMTVGLFAVQGAVSVLSEGRELRPGAVDPLLTTPRTLALAGLSILLIVWSSVVGLAIVTEQPTALVGTAAGAGCLILAVLLLLCKQAFVGHEAHLEVRDDGIPW